MNSANIERQASGAKSGSDAMSTSLIHLTLKERTKRMPNPHANSGRHSFLSPENSRPGITEGNPVPPAGLSLSPTQARPGYTTKETNILNTMKVPGRDLYKNITPEGGKCHFRGVEILEPEANGNLSEIQEITGV